MVTVDGELDASNADAAAEAIRAAIRLAGHTIVVDALGVTFIDAAGRRAMDCQSAATAAGVRPLLLASTCIQQFDGRLVGAHASSPTEVEITGAVAA
jgi:4-aminobutyrate aminotransferase-like enzyme